MSKFIVLYRAPVSALDDWMKTPEAERKTQEDKMKADWNAWMEKNGSHVLETAGAGATKLVTNDGVKDSRNDIMLYSLVQADSQEAAAALFEGHPHFGIPGATIEVMTANVLPGMER